jgi:pseudaminic acid synthase
MEQSETKKTVLRLRMGSKWIGDGLPVFCIAELSANHLQDMRLAEKMIRAAKKAGADAVKIQTLTPDTMTIDCNNRYFKVTGKTPWDGRSFYSLYSQTCMPWEWHERLQKLAAQLGLVFFSTPYDPSSTDFLAQLKVPAYKIASFEMTDVPFIRHVARKGKPVLMSTGVARVDEIDDAVRACRSTGNSQIVLLKCTSMYPAPLEELNLQNIRTLRKRYSTLVGLSDHTLDLNVCSTAVALGICMVEKHFTMDRKLGGPDAAFSLQPEEFQKMVALIRKTEKMLGDGLFKLSKGVKRNRQFCRSLFAVQDIKKGESFCAENIRSIRPGFGLSPKHYDLLLKKKASRDIRRGTPLEWSMVSKRTH